MIPALTSTDAYATDDARWQTVQARDHNADAHFVYAVRTTGVYCRPSSSARLPKRANVEFFSPAEAAEQAGCRANRRIKADKTRTAVERSHMVKQACRPIHAFASPPSLAVMRANTGLNPYPLISNSNPTHCLTLHRHF